MKKILITGNMGYVGPNVVWQLKKAFPGAVLVGLDAGYFADCLTHTGTLPETRVDLQYFADVRDAGEEVMNGVGAVVHLAAISNDAMGKAHDDVTLDVNFRSSVRMAEMAKRSGARAFVFASSCSTYGFADDGARTEESEVNPLTAYARSKIETERALRDVAGDGFQVTCLRFATACGMSERLRLDLVLNDFVASAVATGKIEILSDGRPWRPLIHVRDMARAIEWAVTRPEEKGGPYLVINAGCDEWNYQIRDLAYAVQKCFDDVEVRINEDASPDKRSYRVSFGKFRELAPGYQPQVTLEQAVRELKESLHAMNFRDARFRESRLVRLNVLSTLRREGQLGEDLRFRKEYNHKGVLAHV